MSNPFVSSYAHEHYKALKQGHSKAALVSLALLLNLYRRFKMKIFSTILMVVLVTGCSASRIWYGSDVARLSFVQIEAKLDGDGEVTSVELRTESSESVDDGKEKKHLGALMAWSPEFNAAFISQSGNGCIQPATYSKTNSANASVPAEIISSGVSNGNVTADFSQALEKLITVTDQSTFLSIGVYGLCQLHANGGLTKDQLASLTKVLFEKAASAQGSSKDEEDDSGNDNGGSINPRL